MKQDQYRIVVLGEPSHVYVTCSYLATELKGAGVNIVPVIMNSDPEDAIRHAFTPFSPVFSPVFNRPETSKKTLDSIAIRSRQQSEALSFNFADYGEPSAAVNFHQAYDACKKSNPNTPNISAFMTRNKSTFGICYQQEETTQIFKNLCFNENIYTIFTREVSATIQNGFVTEIMTKEGQKVAGDLYIDCSQTQVLMSQLQHLTAIPNNTIPPYRTESKLTPTQDRSFSKLTSEENLITCNSQTNDLAEERRYIFGESENQDQTQASYYSQPWFNNCVALGQGYCEIPELLICKDRILETQLQILALFLPITSDFASAQSHFAMHSQRILDDAIDTANLLIVDACPTAELSHANTLRKGLFESSGATYQREIAMINNSCWGALMRQVGFEPISTNALAEARPPADITRKLMQLVTGA